jgi:hypothetical protein
MKSQRQRMKMTEKRAETATPHLREAPEQQQQVEHEEAIEDAGKDGKRVGAGFEKRKDPLNSAFLKGDRGPTAHLRPLQPGAPQSSFGTYR